MHFQSNLHMEASRFRIRSRRQEDQDQHNSQGTGRVTTPIIEIGVIDWASQITGIIGEKETKHI